MKRSITNVVPTNSSCFHHVTMKPGKKLHSETFHSGNTAFPFFEDDTNNTDRCSGSPTKKQCMGLINHSLHRQNIPVSYRSNVPPPPTDDPHIDNNGIAPDRGNTNVYNGNARTFGSKCYGPRSNGSPFYNASFIPRTNNRFNVNTSQNAKPLINNNITSNMHRSEDIIYRPPVGFQQQNLQMGDSNNVFVRSNKVDENKFAVNGATTPLCKKGNMPLHISDTFQGNMYDVHRTSQPTPIQMNRNYPTTPPPNYKKMNVHKMHNYGEQKPMDPYSCKTIKNEIQNSVCNRTNSDSKSKRGYQNLNGVTNSFLSGSDVEQRPLQVQGSGYKCPGNSSDRKTHNYCRTQIPNQSNSSLLSKEGHENYFTNCRDTHQKDDNTNYFDSQKQHSVPEEQNTIVANNRRTSNDKKLQNSSKEVESELEVVTEEEAETTNENQSIELVEAKCKTVFCNVCTLHVKSTTYKEHEKTEHVECPLDNCNEVYNVNDFEYHLLKHIKKENSNKSILEDPEEIKKWVAERKKNYPLRKNIHNQSSSDKTQQETGDKSVSKKLKKPNCLIEELLFENYCTAIGKHIMYKKKKDKSIFVPLFTQMEKSNYQDIYGKEYYSYFEESGEKKCTDHLKQQKTNVHYNNSNHKCNKIIESLNIHKTPPLLYQLMRNDILEYERKLMSCIIYITENNFFDKDEEKDIVELK